MDTRTTLIALLAAGVFGYLVYLLAPILTPFLISALLAYLFDPFVDRLEARKFNRTAAVIVVFVILSIILLVSLLVLVPRMQQQIVIFAGKVPGYLDWLQSTLAPWLQATFGIETAVIDLETVKKQIVANWQDVGGWVGRFVAYVTRSGVSIGLWFANLILVPVVTFYLLRDWDHIVARVHDLIPRRYEKSMSTLAQETDGVLAAFLRGQFLVMLSLGAIYSLGLLVIGLDLALPIGVAAGLVSFVPYLGFIVGLLAAGVGAILQFQEFTPLLWVLLVFGIGQMLESMVLTPYLVGDRVGLHPVAVIFAVMAGGQLFGFTGVLLALPAAAAAMVWLRDLHTRYQTSALYQD